MRELKAIDVQTALGVVPVRGRFGGFDAGRPLVLSIGGAFAPPSYMSRLPDRLPDCDVALVRLPGMSAPLLSRTSVAAFAEAFDEMLASRFAGRRALRVGFSVGGLVALAMRQGEAFVAVDPPLSTGALWPMTARLRAVAQADALVAGWVDAIFGVTPAAVEDRDYGRLLASLAQPGVVLIAGEPLEPERQLPHLPGLLGAADRARVARTPGVHTIVAAGCGHNLPLHAPGAVLGAIRAGLAQLA